MKIFIGILLVASALTANFDCGVGSVVNHQGVCVSPKYIEGCNIYAQSASCNQCSFNYALLNGKCQYQSSLTKPCCKSRDPYSGQCKQCQNGLFIEKGKCVQKRIIGCLSQDLKGDCLNCDKRFFLENGQCKKGVQNCQQYTSFGDVRVCNRCVAGHSFINNACVANTILGCKSESSKGVCSQCYNPFILKKDHCQVPNCKSHNDFGCSACECGYFITRQRKCADMPNGCIRASRGVCTDCMNHFALKGNVCQIEGCSRMDGITCAECQEGYVSNQIGCQLANCLQSQNGFCNVCKEGYRQKDGSCIQEKVVQI